MKKIFKLIIIILLLTACGKDKYKLITTNEAIELINDGATIIDVRTPEEYSREHISGAINIPLDMIDSISIDTSSKIVVYCQSGMRSKQAVEKLAKLGYKNLYNLDGGLLNWGGSLEEE